MGDPAAISPTDRASIRALAARIVDSVRADEEMPIGVEPWQRQEMRPSTRRDIETLLAQMAQEIEALNSELHDASICRNQARATEREVLSLLDRVEAAERERDEAKRIGLSMCRRAHNLVTLIGNGQYADINEAHDRLVSGIQDVRDLSLKLADSEHRARKAERVNNSLREQLATARDECESRGARLSDEFAVGAEYQKQATVAQAECERLRASGSGASDDSSRMTNDNDCTVKLQLAETREKQATDMCTWLTAENQRLRDALKLAENLDGEMDSLLESSEEDAVQIALLTNRLAAMTAARDELADLALAACGQIDDADEGQRSNIYNAEVRIAALRAVGSKEAK